MFRILLCGLFIVLASCGSKRVEAPKEVPKSEVPKLGTVNFPASCSEEANKHITSEHCFII
jgi:hypothetical protein